MPNEPRGAHHNDGDDTGTRQRLLEACLPEGRDPRDYDSIVDCPSDQPAANHLALSAANRGQLAMLRPDEKVGHSINLALGYNLLSKLVGGNLHHIYGDSLTKQGVARWQQFYAGIHGNEIAANRSEHLSAVLQTLHDKDKLQISDLPSFSFQYMAHALVQYAENKRLSDDWKRPPDSDAKAIIAVACGELMSNDRPALQRVNQFRNGMTDRLAGRGYNLLISDLGKDDEDISKLFSQDRQSQVIRLESQPSHERQVGMPHVQEHFQVVHRLKPKGL
jgi:hypothetical protein